MTDIITPHGQSDITSYLGCPRRHYYRHVRGYIPKEGNTAMTMGSVFHAGAAAGYRGEWSAWLNNAWNEAMRFHKDRDGREIDLDEEKRLNVCDMLTYYWEHVGQHDRFDRILAVEEPMLLNVEMSPGVFETIRGTADLVVEQDGELVIYDHKTSASIDEDQAHLALDSQTHVYYLQAFVHWRRPLAFVHNFVRRFERKDKTVVGPPSYARTSGMTPYALTETGKARTASDDPNDYVRRTRTPLSEKQLAAYYTELRTRLKMFEFSKAADCWPRVESKMGFGCKSCAYYAPCVSELSGNELDENTVRMIYDVR